MPRLHLQIVALLLLTWSSVTVAADRSCTVVEKKSADRQLWLNVRDRQISIHKHLPWGEPSERLATSPERMLTQRDYVVRYDDDLKIPLYVAERIDSTKFKAKIKRTDCFRADPRIPPPLASSPKDYAEPIFDQGHLAPFADQATSIVAGNNSFIMSNMAPQTCQFNRGIWQILEGVVRLWGADHKTIYVISGSILDKNGDGVRDADDEATRMKANAQTTRVAIPTAFFKIVYAQNADKSLDTLTVVLPHNEANPNADEALTYLQNHLTTIDNIQRRTGFQFFPQGPVIHEAAALWSFDRSKMPKSLCYTAPDPSFEGIWQR